MADKRISQLVDRGTVVNNDVVPIVVFGATTTNKTTISSIQTYMQENLDVGVTSVGITLGTTGTNINVTGSPITTSGNITINIPDASATARGVVNTGTQTFAGIKSFNGTIVVNQDLQLAQAGTALTTFIKNINGTGLSSFGSNGFGFNNSNNVYFSGSNKGGGVLAFSNTGTQIYTLQDASGTLAFTSDISTALTGYVTLATAQTITAQKTFTTSGSTDSVIISQGSGSGIALDVIKAGSGQALRVQKTSGGGDAVTITGGRLSAEVGLFTSTLSTNTGGHFISLNANLGGATNRIESSARPLEIVTAGSAITLAAGGATPQFTLTSSGNLGIGTSTPQSTGNFTHLDVVGKNTTSGGAIWVSNSDKSTRGIFYNINNLVYSGTVTNHDYLLITNDTERVRISSTGAATFSQPGNPSLTLTGTDGAYTSQLFLNSSGGGTSKIIANGGTNTLVLGTNNVDRLSISSTGAATFSSSVTANGTLRITRPADTSQFIDIYSSGGEGFIDAVNSAAGTSAALVFRNGNSGGITERMRITSGGDVLVGTQTLDPRNFSTGNYGIKLERTLSEFAVDTCVFNRTSGTNGQILQFRRNGLTVGSIDLSTVLTTYNTTSDYRLKEDLQEIKGLEKVQAIKVYDYKWKSEDSRMDGVLAHELAKVLPYAVTGEKDEVNEDGTDKMQGVDYSKIVPILIKAIQEQQEQIDSLKNQIK